METKVSNSKEKRRFTRVPFDAAVYVKDPQGQWHGKLMDISLKGALITRPQGWHNKVGDRVLLEVHAPHDTFEIRMEAEVAHANGQRVGFHCCNIDIDSMTHLRRLVELNTGDQALLERELAALGE